MNRHPLMLPRSLHRGHTELVSEPTYRPPAMRCACSLGLQNVTDVCGRLPPLYRWCFFAVSCLPSLTSMATRDVSLGRGSRGKDDEAEKTRWTDQPRGAMLAALDAVDMDQDTRPLSGFFTAGHTTITTWWLTLCGEPAGAAASTPARAGTHPASLRAACAGASGASLTTISCRPASR